MKIFKAMSMCMVVFAVAGCSHLTPPFEHPIIEQHAQDRINTFGVIPSRRMVLVKKEMTTEDRKIVICAEAPADVTDNLAAQLAASLSAEVSPGPTGNKSIDASAAINRTLNTYAQFLFKRTQGIQLFRDRSYHLCQARMNGFIDDKQYLEATNKLMDEAAKLIEKEIPYLQNTQPQNQAVSISTGSVGASSTAGAATSKAGAGEPAPEAKTGKPATSANGGSKPAEPSEPPKEK